MCEAQVQATDVAIQGVFSNFGVALLYKLMGTTTTVSYESHSGKVTVGTSLSGEVRIVSLISIHVCIQVMSRCLLGFEHIEYFVYRFF